MSYPQAPSALPVRDLNIREYVDVLRRRRDVFGLVFSVAIVLGMVSAVRSSKPVYQAPCQDPGIGGLGFAQPGQLQ